MTPDRSIRTAALPQHSAAHRPSTEDKDDDVEPTPGDAELPGNWCLSALRLDATAAPGASLGLPYAPQIDVAAPGVRRLEEPPEGVLALLLADQAVRSGGRGVIHVARSESRARRLARAAQGFAPALEVLVLPPWDCLPYDRASPSRAIMGERIAALCSLALAPPAGGRLLVTTIDALLQRVPPRASWQDAGFALRVGDQPALEELKEYLIRTGYLLDERVDEPGEAAIRGGVIEIFPADAERPYRLELAEDRISEIRCYDPLTQRAIATVAQLTIRPASELILDTNPPERSNDAAGGLAAHVFSGPPESPRRASGIEHHLPLFYDRLETVFDLLLQAIIALDPEVDERREAWLEQVADAHASCVALRAAGRAGMAPELQPLEPRRLYLGADEWEAALSRRAVIAFRTNGDVAGLEARAVPRFAGTPDPGRAVADHMRERVAAGDRVVLAAAGERDRRRLARLVERRARLEVQAIPGWAQVADVPPASVVSVALDLAGGFRLPGLTLIAAADVYAEVDRPTGLSPRVEVALGADELRPGDLVVHADHGVGVLRGLDVVEGEAGCECLAIEYAGGRRLLVPVTEIGHVWRYGGGSADVPLDRLNCDGWLKRKEEVEAQLAAVAGGLAELARERAQALAPKITAPNAAYRRFAARFPFSETDDQARAIAATLADLARGMPPMDRLVCGDVGFGKTEVALRAACAAALDGRQVAMIAPTTVLVRQHLNTFRRRFAGFDVSIEQLSRIASGKEARAVRAGIADGSVRIVIGTHALTSDKVRFQDLGLVIIDEEQRFGVQQKEQLRALSRHVHVLTLSATPIPRTLQAALAGLIDISVIATPPVRRRPVRTFIVPFDPVVVRQALRRERERGGQSFVVCPRIRDLAPMGERLAGLVTELDVVVAHGRMKSDQLDEVVVGFAERAHDVLLCTDIVEAGLDIPNANTMLVWQADRFGLAQLHQLRGRVGRGRQQAVAYLLTDPKARPGAPAEQRLRTLQALVGLGAGFATGARDLDLRGAGDLLGADQAGHLRLIGTSLYQRLLERALRRARGEPDPDDEPAPEVNLGLPTTIPAGYVPEEAVRIALYRKLAELRDEAEVEEFSDELADRFGPPPAEVVALLDMASIRERCRRLGVARLEAGPKGLAFTFRDAAAARADAAVADQDGMAWREDRLIVSRPSSAPEERPALARSVLERLEEAGDRRDRNRSAPPAQGS